MKFGVVVFPGSNCDDDIVHVLRDVNNSDVQKIWHKASTLPDFNLRDAIVIPGGFSYGDYLRSGAIAKLSPVMGAVRDFAQAGGLVIGICNGFQILCEAGLLPGALLHNAGQKFICKNVYLRASTTNSVLTRHMKTGQVVQIPIAHAEGRFYTDDASLRKMKDNDQIIFQYCNKQGELTATANPNGSLYNIAGICNEGRNVYGMMPHPERAAEEILGNTDGQYIFESILKIAQEVQLTS